MMRFLRRLRYWLRLSSHDADMEDELVFHREMIERDLVERGMSPTDAAAQARRTMGNETMMREESRSVWLWPWLEGVMQDARYTLRDLRRHPAFTLGVVLTLALGIGANAAMFGIVDRLLFRPPAQMIDPSTVHRVYLYRRTEQGEERPTGAMYARINDLAKWSRSFSQTAGFARRTLAIGQGEDTRLGSVAIVSASFFSLFDAPPMLGRYFTAAEDMPPTPAPVVVLGSRLWRSRYGSRADVIGSMVQIDAVQYTIIGVAPDGFTALWPYAAPAAFIPISMYAASEGRPDWATTYTHSFGSEMLVRRRPGVSIDAASADLTNALRQSYAQQYGPNAIGQRGRSVANLQPRALAASILPGRGPSPSSVTRATTWLSGVTLTVLLIACANVGNLLLARTIRRRREIALRLALGVSRARLFAQLLTEGLILAMLGGVAALAIAVWGGSMLRAAFLPGAESPSLFTDTRTLLFAGAVALGVGILVGLVPIAQVTRGSLTADLKSGSRSATYQRRSLRTGLLLVQCALSLVLLVGAGLFVQSLDNVRSVRLGFDADSVLLAELKMRDVRIDSATAVALRLRLLDAAQRLPGVASASLQEAVPFAGMSSLSIHVDGIDSTQKFGQFNFNTVSADYFRTMGTRIVRGRGLTGADAERAPRVAVVGASMASVLWPGQDPIGKCFRMGADTAPCTYVVGVAEDIHSETFEAESRLFYYYIPAAQWHPQEGGLFVRASGPASRLVEPLRRQLQREMPGASFVTVTQLSEIVDSRRRSWIAGATVFTGFGVLALLLAAVGLYSVIAYHVAQRKQELGVRVALGAARSGIVSLVVLEGVRFAAIGVAMGSGVAWALARWVGPLLFQQSPRDPAVFTMASVVLLGVALLATSVPALRAATVDPKTALEAD